MHGKENMYCYYYSVAACLVYFLLALVLYFQTLRASPQQSKNGRAVRSKKSAQLTSANKPHRDLNIQPSSSATGRTVPSQSTSCRPCWAMQPIYANRDQYMRLMVHSSKAHPSYQDSHPSGCKCAARPSVCSSTRYWYEAVRQCWSIGWLMLLTFAHRGGGSDSTVDI